MTKRRNYLLLGIMFGVLFLFLTLVNTNLKEVFFILTTINLIPVFLGLIFLGTGLILKTWRWRILLDSSVLPSRIFAALTIGYLVNNILPARAGELARIYLIGRKEGVGLSKTLGTIIIEKILDTFVLILMLAGLLLSSPTLPAMIKPFFVGFVFPEKWQIRWKLFLSSFRLLKDKKKLIFLFLLTVIIWLAEGLWNYSLLMSLDISVPFLAAFFLVAVVNLGLFLPSPPGYIGVFHFLATFALLPFGVDKSQALSYALLQHTLEYFILSALGCWSAFKLSFNPLGEKKWKNL